MLRLCGYGIPCVRMADSKRTTLDDKGPSWLFRALSTSADKRIRFRTDILSSGRHFPSGTRTCQAFTVGWYRYMCWCWQLAKRGQDVNRDWCFRVQPGQLSRKQERKTGFTSRLVTLTTQFLWGWTTPSTTQQAVKHCICIAQNV